MNKRSRVIAVFMSALLVLILMAVVGISNISSFYMENTKLNKIKKTLPDSLMLKAEMDGYKKIFDEQVKKIESEINKRKQDIASTSFVCKPEDKIPEFISDIQTIFNNSGINLDGLGYAKRKKVEGIIFLPFEAQLSCTYTGMRRVLFLLETHNAGIKINKLEIVNYNDENHKIKLKLSCTARFKAVG